MTDDDRRRRLAEIASKVRRGVRHPDLIAVCEGVLAMVAERSSSISFSHHMARFARLLILPLALEAKKKPQRELVVRYLPWAVGVVSPHMANASLRLPKSVGFRDSRLT